MPLPKIDLLMFDLDGTLVDTRQDLTNSVNHARQVFGLPPLDIVEVVGYVGDGVRKLLERSLPDATPDQMQRALSEFRQHYSEHLLDHSVLYPGVEEILQRFLDKKKAVISNKPEAFCKIMADELGLSDRFDMVVGGDTVNALKPDPAPLLHVLQNLTMPGDRAVMIGDGPGDILAARAAGAHSCAVTYGFREKGQLSELSPDFIIDDIRELADFCR